MFRNKKIVVFGTSTGAKKVSQTLKSLAIEVDYFSDNNCNMWGKLFEEKEVLIPQTLKSISCYIIIASMYYMEIYDQLVNLGIANEQIIPKEVVITEYLDNCWKCDINSEILSETENRAKNANTIILDVSEGYQLSGAVRWTLYLADGLMEASKKMLLYAKDDSYKNMVAEKYQSKQVFFNMEYENYAESVKVIAKEMAKKLPCTVIVNTIAQNFMAAYLLKKRYPDEVKIISVIHSDFQKFYDSNVFLAPWIDKYVCVSKKIADTMLTKYGMQKEKVIFRNSPVTCEKNYKKEYPNEKKCIQIAYAARLEKAQKRADLLLEVIKKLEKKQISYELNIAGDGSLKNKIEEFIVENKLESKVKLLGTLEYAKMEEFWKKNDIFINVSDCEGMSLAMLEAMSYGLAPVVTNTSGVESIVKHGNNGYVSEILDMESLAGNIEKLLTNPRKIKEFGERSKRKIEEVCNMKLYIEEILK